MRGGFFTLQGAGSQARSGAWAGSENLPPSGFVQRCNFADQKQICRILATPNESKPIVTIEAATARPWALIANGGCSGCIVGGLVIRARCCGEVPARRSDHRTIDDIHNAIKDGQITCKGVVQTYIDCAKAYNGIGTQLVTKDGAAIPPAKGAVRAGSPLAFPKRTCPVFNYPMIQPCRT